MQSKVDHLKNVEITAVNWWYQVLCSSHITSKESIPILGDNTGKVLMLGVIKIADLINQSYVRIYAIKFSLAAGISE